MKKTTRIITLFLIVTLIATLFAGCSAKKKLVGTWENEDEDQTMVLASDGTGSIKAEGMSASLTWSVEGKTLFLTITVCGQTESSEMIYKVSGNKLILTDEDGEQTIYYKVKK